MRVRNSWVCAVAVVGTALFAGCGSPTPVTKYDVAYDMEVKADKASDAQTKAKNYTDAIATYREFIAFTENPKNAAYKDLAPLATYKIALCYRGLGKKTEALAAYKEVMDKYPGDVHANWARGESAELEKKDLTPLPAPMPPAKPMAPAKPSSGMAPAK